MNYIKNEAMFNNFGISYNCISKFSLGIYLHELVTIDFRFILKELKY